MRNFIDYGDRRSGRTTRIIDQCIQEFFQNKHTVCFDHFPTDKMREYVMKRVIKRLDSEHNIEFVFAKFPYYVVAQNQEELTKAKREIDQIRIQENKAR